MKRHVFTFLIMVFLFSCDSRNVDTQEIVTIDVTTNDTEVSEEPSPFHKGKNIYETEEEYINAYYDFNYWEYRKAMLNRCLENNNFEYFEDEILDNDELVGNQKENDYMEIIREVIYIKNNLSFHNTEIDDEFKSIYNYYDPENPKELSTNEKRILLQINSYLNPAEEKIGLEEIDAIILGIWQKNSYDIHADYLDTLRFTDELMAITTNSMDSSRKFKIIEGKYKIENNTITMYPEYYDYINSGKYFFGDPDGLIQEYLGKNVERITLTPNSTISYPIISLTRVYNEFEQKYYYKLLVFIDRPVVYYKVEEKWEKMPWD